MLHIEWRWVDSTLNAAAIGAIRDGSSTWSTAGNVTPKPGGTITSTRSAEDRVSPVQELRVLNGHEASQRFETPALIQWVEGDRNRAKLRGQPSVRVNSFAVTPQWPGGAAPIKLGIRLTDGQAEFSTTVSQPMNEWRTVLRSGAQPKAPQAGVTSTRDAEVVQQRELQMRVSVEP
ncbi:hypothetical protein ACFJGW_06875 [Burkholderiaceae bacterium UC74_6]